MNKLSARIQAWFSSKPQPESPIDASSFKEWSAAHGQKDKSERYRAFKVLLVSLEGDIERPRLETMDELWYHNESSEAIDILIDNLIDLEPRPALTDEQQTAILRFAKEEDQFQWKQWQEYYDEMGPEKLEQHGIKRPRNLTAEFMEKYPSRRKTSVGLVGLHKFFFVYFYNDSAGDMTSLDEALETYLKREQSDSRGELLLKEVDALLARNLTDHELAQIIEIEWDTEADNSTVGSWTAVLHDMHAKLTASNLS
jgi:hypothetical protein